jgi:hypothetical protein
MKSNIFQKTTLILFILNLIAFAIWFVPYRVTNEIYNDYDIKYEKVIVYESIISEHYSIDLYRTCVILTILILLYGSIFLLLNKLPNPDFSKPEVKKIIKKEFLYTGILVAIMIGGNIYCYIKNVVFDLEIRKQEAISKQILEINETNTYFAEKEALRKSYFDAMKDNFFLYPDTTPDLLIDTMTKNINNIKWNVIFELIDNDFKLKNNIKNSEDLKNILTFINYTKNDSLLILEINNQTNLKSKSIEYIQKNPYLYTSDFIRIISRLGLVGFIILFVFRFIYYKVKIFITYIRAN